MGGGDEGRGVLGNNTRTCGQLRGSGVGLKTRRPACSEQRSAGLPVPIPERAGQQSDNRVGPFSARCACCPPLLWLVRTAAPQGGKEGAEAMAAWHAAAPRPLVGTPGTCRLARHGKHCSSHACHGGRGDSDRSIHKETGRCCSASITALASLALQRTRLVYPCH